MAEEIRDLIAKIQQDGIRAAEEEADKIRLEAEESAKKIINDAREEAGRILEKADIESKKRQETTQASLKQAGRDFLISLRKEINSTLDRLVKAQINQTISSAELGAIIAALIKNAPLSLGSEIIVSLNQKDKEKLEKEFLQQLIQETKKQVVLKDSDSISGGFIISFDAGKSIFDFSSQALADYISSVLRPEIAEILHPE